MLRGGLQVVTQRNANCKPNSPRAPWSSQLFRAFVLICASLTLFYVSLLVLITVKGLRVATVFISNQWPSRTRPYRHPHLHSIEWRWPQDNWHWVSGSSKLKCPILKFTFSAPFTHSCDFLLITPDISNRSNEITDLVPRFYTMAVKHTGLCVWTMVLRSCAAFTVSASAGCPHASS